MNYILTLGGGVLSYMYRYDIATFLLKSYSQGEIYYSHWMDKPYLSNNIINDIMQDLQIMSDKLTNIFGRKA